MNKRIEILKELYPNYLIYVVKKKKKDLNEIDNKIVKNFEKELKNTNYIVLDNLEIIEKCEYPNNNYDSLFVKTNLIDIIKYYGERYEKKIKIN